jgi:TonB family protein
MPFAMPRLPAGAWPRSVLGWAIVASLAVHGVFLALHFGGFAGGRPAAAVTMLYASLQPMRSAIEEPVAPAVIEAPSDVALAALAAVPAAAREPAAPAEKFATIAGNAARTAEGPNLARVQGEVLADRSRLGDLYARQITEFPIEIDHPVRMLEPVVARYPKAALAQRRDENVGVWVVVNADGAAEEVQVLDGAPEFAEVVVAAVNAAKFVPAENRLHKIRFPLSLEFRFRADAGSVAGAATAAR